MMLIDAKPTSPWTMPMTKPEPRELTNWVSASGSPQEGDARSGLSPRIGAQFPASYMMHGNTWCIQQN